MWWIIASIVGILFSMFIIVFCFALCKASSDADTYAEQQYFEYIKSKNKENNNQKEQGE